MASLNPPWNFFHSEATFDFDEEYNKKRTSIRNSLGLSDQHILIVQAGKMGTKKKILESLRAFQANKRDNLRLLLIGSFDDSIREEAQSLLAASEYVSYLGWRIPVNLWTTSVPQMSTCSRVLSQRSCKSRSAADARNIG